MTRKTVFEVTVVLVDAPLVDGAPAWVLRRGVFSTLAKARSWLSRLIRKEVGEDDGGLRYYVLDTINLDVELRVACRAVFGSDNQRRGIVDGEEKPWGGRPPAECTYKPGDLVGFLSSYEEKYRIGVVQAQPMPPKKAERFRGTVGDDVYLVGTLDKDGSPECSDHDHIPQPLLFPVAHKIPRKLKAALKKRFEDTGW